MKFWCVTGRCGDYRLEAKGEGCMLTVEDPTTEDKIRLDPFREAAISKGWMKEDQVFSATGLTVIEISAPLLEVGEVLAGSTARENGVWTILKCVGGKIELVNGTKIEEPAKVVGAASVPPPQRGCPEPVACERRASEVLRTFCTPQQWADLCETGSMKVIGNHTGKAYRLYHQDEAAAHGHSRQLLDCATGHPVCLWENTLPPDEALLSLKVAIEHAEAWAVQLPGFRETHGELVGALL